MSENCRASRLFNSRQQFPWVKRCLDSTSTDKNVLLCPEGAKRAIFASAWGNTVGFLSRRWTSTWGCRSAFKALLAQTSLVTEADKDGGSSQTLGRTVLRETASLSSKAKIVSPLEYPRSTLMIQAISKGLRIVMDHGQSPHCRPHARQGLPQCGWHSVGPCRADMWDDRLSRPGLTSGTSLSRTNRVSQD